MITVEDALKYITEQTSANDIISLPLVTSLNYTLAENLYAPIDVPVFDNSAMDGYALRIADRQLGMPITVVSEIQAGAGDLPQLLPGQAARIFTGAPIPPGADTVVQQEICQVEHSVLEIHGTVNEGANIRQKASQTAKGSLVSSKGDLLSAPVIAFLATLGIAHVPVFRRPNVGIISTGSELAPPGQPLLAGQIYDSNSVALQAFMDELRIPVLFRSWCPDDASALQTLISERVSKVDILLLTGGISVGDYDYVRPVLDRLGCREIFYKISQKPGKPLFFGKLNNTLIFALPGNPASVISCFHVYVKACIRRMSGVPAERKTYGILMSFYEKKPGMTHFLKAYVENNKVTLTANQLSYQVDSIAKANCLAVLPASRDSFQVGERVEIILF